MQEWQIPDKALEYLSRADTLPHRKEGEAMLLELIPPTVRRVLDLGTGDGRLLGLIKAAYPDVIAVGLDFSPTMLTLVRKRFEGDPSVTIIEHDMALPLPELDRFDAVISSFAIHHLEHSRKRLLYDEIHDLLNPDGVFWNLEHVASPSERVHDRFLQRIGRTRETEDKSNKLLDVETQLQWLRESSFRDVDCYWKWLEFALIGGIKVEGWTWPPTMSSGGA